MQTKCQPRPRSRTERQVDDDVRISEFTADIAMSIREERRWRAPGVRVDRARAAPHVRWDVVGVAREKPDLEECRGALQSVPEKHENSNSNLWPRKKKGGRGSDLTHHPPPLLLKGGPKLLGIVVCTPQPAL